MESTKKNPRYRGLTSYEKPADASPNSTAKTIGVAFYPTALEQLEGLQLLTGMDNRSQLIRAALAFANSHQPEFLKAVGAGTESSAQAFL